jgi:hypothetical protein
MRLTGRGDERGMLDQFVEAIRAGEGRRPGSSPAMCGMPISGSCCRPGMSSLRAP